MIVKLSQLEKAEIAFILVMVSLVVWSSFFGLLPAKIRISSLILILSNIILVQSLLRDLILVTRSKKNKKQLKPERCICLESTIGLSGVVIGGFVMIFLASYNSLLVMSPLKWSVMSALGLISCYMMKDWVLTWSPFGVKYDKDHIHFLVGWS